MGVVTRDLCCIALALIGCGGEAGPEINTGRCNVATTPPIEQPSGLDWDHDEYKQGRATCSFGKGQLPRDTLGDYPPFKDKVAHVIVVLRENRSFDHYLGAYEREQHKPLGKDEDNHNPDPFQQNKEVPRFHTQHYCSRGGDPDHEWNAAHLAFNNGKMNGFVAASNTNAVNSGGCMAMSYFNSDDLPFYYWLADNFAISESYYSSLLGPTMANISYYFNATSCGTTENFETTVINATTRRVEWGNPCPKGNSIVDLLANNNVSMRVYNDSPELLDSAAAGLTNYNPLALRPAASFDGDVDDEEHGRGQLPEVIFIEPNYGHLGLGTQNDEHPPSNIQDGQHFVWDIINTLVKHPNVFAKTVVFISWDENGGYYDHVVPPHACPPDDLHPADFDFDRYGFRVPFFAVSPFAIQHYASQYTADHTSILRFIEAWKGLPALTARDANAWPLLDMFDFDHPHDASTYTKPIKEPTVLDCPDPKGDVQ